MAPLGDRDLPARSRKAASPPVSAPTTIRRCILPTRWLPATGLCDADRRTADCRRRRRRRSSDSARHRRRFDRDAGGSSSLGLEAAHSRRRIVHAGGDATGADIMRALVAGGARDALDRRDRGDAARRLIVDGQCRRRRSLRGRRRARRVRHRSRRASRRAASADCSCTPPIPPGVSARAWRWPPAPARILADLEFVQFHPTALEAAALPLALISEAVRGEGAVLVDERGGRFMADAPGAEFAPRDVVARAVWRHLADGHRVFLDARATSRARLRARGFPTIDRALPRGRHRSGRRSSSRSAPPRIIIWAASRWTSAGAVRSTGCGLAARSLAPACMAPIGSPAIRCWRRRSAPAGSRGMSPADCGNPTASLAGGSAPMPACAAIRLRFGRSCRMPPASCAMREGLRAAAPRFMPLAIARSRSSDPAIVGLMIVIAALRRRESRGAHVRTDFPQRARRRDDRRCALDGSIRRGARDSFPHPVQTFERKGLSMRLSPLPAHHDRAAGADGAARRSRSSRGSHHRRDRAGRAPRHDGSGRRASPASIAGLDLAAAGVSPDRSRRSKCAANARRRSGRAGRSHRARSRGPARGILTAERTALNFLCRLSGIATATASPGRMRSGHQGAHRLHAQNHAGFARDREIRRARRRRRRSSFRPRRCRPDQGQPRRHRRRRHGGAASAPAGPSAISSRSNSRSIRWPSSRRRSTWRRRRAARQHGSGNLTPAVAMIAGRADHGSVRPHHAATAPAIAATGIDLISIGWLTHSVSDSRYRAAISGIERAGRVKLTACARTLPPARHAACAELVDRRDAFDRIAAIDQDVRHARRSRHCRTPQ